MTFEVGDKVWLSAKHIQTARPSKKLDYKRLGPFKVTKVINRNAYRLELPYSMKVHNVFHVSLLDRYVGPVPGQQPSDPPPAITAENPDAEEWEVERVLDSRKRYKRLWYLVQWAGHNYVNTSWEPAETLEGASESGSRFPSRKSGKTKGGRGFQMVHGHVRGSPGIKRLQRRFFPLGFLCAARACQN
jgi:hypothetical protein